MNKEGHLIFESHYLGSPLLRVDIDTIDLIETHSILCDGKWIITCQREIVWHRNEPKNTTAIESVSNPKSYLYHVKQILHKQANPDSKRKVADKYVGTKWNKYKVEWDENGEQIKRDNKCYN